MKAQKEVNIYALEENRPKGGLRTAVSLEPSEDSPIVTWQRKNVRHVDDWNDCARKVKGGKQEEICLRIRSFKQNHGDKAIRTHHLMQRRNRVRRNATAHLIHAKIYV